MIKTRIITTKQKKLLDSTLVALGIELDELLQVNNLREIIEENKLIREQNTLLSEQLDLLNKRVIQLETDIQVLNVKMQKDAIEQIWGVDE